MMRFLAALLLALVSVDALAQTSPNWPLGYVPSNTEWNTILRKKQDYPGGGGIASVALALPNIFNISGSPVAGSGASGTLTGTFASQTAKTFFAAPTGGGIPSFRAMLPTDMPLSGVTPGSYTNTSITVDGYGRVTNASTGSGGGGGGSPGGSNGNIQYNNAGSFGGLTDAQVAARIGPLASSYFNVVAYGADPTGAADSTAAINTAIAAAQAVSGGSCVYFPGSKTGAASFYKVTTLTALNTSNRPCLIGDSPYSSVIATTSATGNVISMTGGGMYQIRGLGFTYTGGGHRTSGCYIAAFSNWGTIENVTMDYALCGIDSRDNVAYYHNILFETISATAASTEVFIKISAAAAGGVTIDRTFNAAFSGTLPLACVMISSVDNPSVTWSNSDCLSSQNGLVINNPAGCACGGFITNVHLDTGGNGFVVVPTGTGNVARWAVTNLWASSGTQTGVYIKTVAGTSVLGIGFDNTVALANGADGFLADASGGGSIEDIRISNGVFAGNSGTGIKTIGVAGLSIMGNATGIGGGVTGNIGGGISVNGGNYTNIVGNVARGNGGANIFNGSGAPTNQSLNTCGGSTC